MINIIVLWQTVYTQAALDHLARSQRPPPQPRRHRQALPTRHPTINLNGRYQTTSNPRLPADSDPFGQPTDASSSRTHRSPDCLSLARVGQSSTFARSARSGIPRAQCGQEAVENSLRGVLP
jgi:hypothetical protein